MEGSILQNLGERAILATKGCMFVACFLLGLTRRYKLFLAVIMINIMGFLLELFREKIQKSFHQMEEYVSYANIIRLHISKYMFLGHRYAYIMFNSVTGSQPGHCGHGES
jgi:hypothetical protein